ncbi:hypothetical protein ISP15_13750 [Dyella jejuensis]|uniref:Chorismate lyase n=1 Tax=Dyella jejuensis TaxID=1432009 RepID=A0ABW8JNG5_9GAMM
MFGWLAARSSSLCRHAPLTVVSRRSRRIHPLALWRKLPALGSVLYLHVASGEPPVQALPRGLLVGHRAFAPLLDTRWLVATSAVTDDGPREWFECMDAFGRTQARLHLLPDTDYFAWEALMAPCEPERRTPVSAGVIRFRPDSASVTAFRLRELAGIAVLESGRPARLSPLGDRIAARIAHAESAVLTNQGPCPH